MLLGLKWQQRMCYLPYLKKNLNTREKSLSLFLFNGRIFSTNCALLTYLFALSVSDISFAKDPVIRGYGSISPHWAGFY